MNGCSYREGVVHIVKCLESISPIGLTLLSIVVALIFVLSFDSDELDVLGNVFIGIGGIIIITATQGDFLDGLSGNNFEKTMLEAQLLNLQN